MNTTHPISASLMHRILCAAALFCAIALPAHAAKISIVKGKVSIIRGEQRLLASPGFVLKEGDEISSEEESQVLFRFNDGARGLIRADSKLIVKNLKLKGPAANRQKTIRIVKGSLRYISGKVTVRSKVAFETNTATIGIRGTDIEILVSEQAVGDNNPGTFLKVNTGEALLTATDGASVSAAAGDVVYGGEPELAPRGSNQRARASARSVQGISALFKSSALDRMMK
jgi:OmpA-OmpF porin, OOP family